MDEQGLWKFFFATGSPLVWLEIRRRREEERISAAFLRQEERKLI